MIRRPPRSTLFPYTTLFRSVVRTLSTAEYQRTEFIDQPVTLIRVIVGKIVFQSSKELPFAILLAFEADTNESSLEDRSEEHTSELQSHLNLVCRLLLEKKKK